MGVSAVVGGALIGGYMSSSGAKSAADTQAQAAAQSEQTQLQMFNTQVGLTAPWRAAGQTALDQLTTGTQPGGEFNRQFSLSDALNSPTEQVASKTALEAMQNQMARGGQNLSTNAISGAGELASNIGANYENQAFNQWLTNRNSNMSGLQSLAGLGMNATNTTVGAAGTAGSNISGLQVGAGNAMAAGQVGSANAIGSAFSNIGQNYSNMYMLSSLLNPNGPNNG